MQMARLNFADLLVQTNLWRLYGLGQGHFSHGFHNH